MRYKEPLPEPFKTQWPFYWFSQINAAYTDAIERRIKPLGVDMPRWRAMMSLHEDTYLSVSEIAAHSAQKLNTTTKVVQRMLKDGLVETRSRPSDGRVTEVCLTETGEALRAKAFVEVQSVYDQVFGTHSTEQISALNEQLTEVHRLLRRL